MSAIAGQERGYYAECRTAKRLVAKVERLDNGTSTADKQALPLQIRVTERPSVSNYWDLPDDLEVKATDDLVAGTPVRPRRATPPSFPLAQRTRVTSPQARCRPSGCR